MSYDLAVARKNGFNLKERRRTRLQSQRWWSRKYRTYFLFGLTQLAANILPLIGMTQPEVLPATLHATREPQRAVSPGRAAVFYRQGLVLGGGWIA